MSEQKKDAKQYTCVKIQKIFINNFRRFVNVELNFGSNLTLICGRNCTSKSTALGLICQPLSFGEKKTKKKSVYLDSYHDFDLSKYKTLTGIPFKRDTEQIFRLAKDFDKPKDMLYHIFFEGESVNCECKNLVDGLQVRSEPRTTTKNKWMRFVTGKTHNAGEGNFIHPLIYLGLNRLYPLASCNSVELIDDVDLSAKEKEWYDKTYNEILLLNEYQGTVEFVHGEKGRQKKYLGHRTNEYNSESCSAGQDNVGQILTSILSFEHLKEKLKENYQGGMLLIDEVDATLHPQAQEHLLNVLVEASRKLSLQVIATTHSLYMLQLAYKSKLRPDIKVIHLEREDRNVICNEGITYEDLCADLKVDMPQLGKPQSKTVVLLEDKLSVKIFNNLIGNSLKDIISCPSQAMSGPHLKYLSTLDIPCFKEHIYIMDGDLRCLIPPKTPKNLFALPGNWAPEKDMYHLLNSLPQAHEFWKKKRGYKKDVCFKNHQNYADDNNPTDIEGREKEVLKYKKWYKEQEAILGHSIGIILNFWLSQRKEECEKFCELFISSLEKIRREEIPSEIGCADEIMEKCRFFF